MGANESVINVESAAPHSEAASRSKSPQQATQQYLRHDSACSQELSKSDRSSQPNGASSGTSARDRRRRSGSSFTSQRGSGEWPAQGSSSAPPRRRESRAVQTCALRMLPDLDMLPETSAPVWAPPPQPPRRAQAQSRAQTPPPAPPPTPRVQSHSSTFSSSEHTLTTAGEAAPPYAPSDSHQPPSEQPTSTPRDRRSSRGRSLDRRIPADAGPHLDVPPEQQRPDGENAAAGRAKGKRTRPTSPAALLARCLVRLAPRAEQS